MFLCRLFSSVHRRKVLADEEQRLNRVNQEPIPAAELVHEYRRRRRNKGLHYEFKAIEVISAGDKQSASIRSEGQHKVADTARQEANRAKNLSERVLPYERNIVRLDNGNYINASWVDGYNQPKKFIASQGPLATTKHDFWYMIWQYKCHCIVMATNLFEHARQQCDKYWHSAQARFGDIDVWMEDTYSTAEYETRVFRICKVGCQHPHYVRQFQFKNWSQHDAPLPSTMIEIRRKVHDWIEDKTEPIVVHCSDGSGRTGTYICIDVELSRVEASRPVDILRQTLALRKARPGLVGNLGQYRYVYETVCACVTCRQTSVRIFQYVRRVRSLARRESDKTAGNSRGGRSGFEAEFESLAALVRPLSVGDCAGGHRAENRWKSRDVMVQPPEQARPYLLTQDNAFGTDFINAVYVDGHCRANQYIVTQWPLKNTVNDFWKLIRDHNVNVVVVLSEFREDSRSYPRFWPPVKGIEATFGPVSVLLQDEFDWSNCVRVQLCCLNRHSAATGGSLAASHENEQQRPRYLVLLYLKGCWQRGHRCPSANHGLLEIACIAELANRQLVCTSPILVVSDNGVSRCGVFCVLHMSMDKMRFEGELDVFRAVEKVRRNRPQLVDSLIEYQLCYSVLQLLVEYFFAGRVVILEDQTLRLQDLSSFPKLC